MRFKAAALALVLPLAACGNYPRDPNGTLDRVRNSRSFSVGLAAPLDKSAPEVGVFLDRLGRELAATPQAIDGDAETLLTQLEEGKIDLVIGQFEKKSPWLDRVTIGPPLRLEPQDKLEFLLAPAMSNGENAWIALIEREVRDIAPHAQ